MNLKELFFKLYVFMKLKDSKLLLIHKDKLFKAGHVILKLHVKTIKVPLNLLGSLAYLKDQSLSIFGQSFFFDFAKGVRCFGGFTTPTRGQRPGFLGRWERVRL